MAAVINAPFGHHDEFAARRPAPARPQLVLIEGGRSAASRAVYRRRRLGTAAVAAIVMLCLWLAWGIVCAPTPSYSRNPATGGGAAPPVPGAEFVAKPGDTLWDVATGLHLGGDVRDVVDRLADYNGSASLTAGQVVRIPADLIES